MLEEHLPQSLLTHDDDDDDDSSVCLLKCIMGNLVHERI